MANDRTRPAAPLAVDEVWRVVFMIGTRAYLDGTLGREAARERDRERVLAELARDLRDSDKA